ncbi:MAG: hypothetical protein WB511_04850 [Nitrososphaeraceae archaeon]
MVPACIGVQGIDILVFSFLYSLYGNYILKRTNGLRRHNSIRIESADGVKGDLNPLGILGDSYSKEFLL